MHESSLWEVCVGAVLLLAGMGAQAGPAPVTVPPGLDAAKGDLLVFTDGSDPKFNYTFVVAKDGVFAQKSTAFGDETRWLYWVQALPANIEKQLTVWIDRPGEVPLPWPKRYERDRPWFCRIRIPPAKEVADQPAYFENENRAMAAFLRLLRDATIDEKYRIQHVPEWIIQDKRLTRWTGFLGVSTDPETFRPLTPEEAEWQKALSSRLFQLEKQAKDLADKGKHQEAGLLFSQIAAARELLVWRFRKDDKPWALEEDALKEFRAAGKGDAYESFLRAKYPCWNPGGE